ncbi:MAG: ATP-binding cassette domain-containing protein [Spirochaetales bacterium]|nr:ATP-binding cassette domain-containing protein [Spirochaetales bacterium]
MKIENLSFSYFDKAIEKKVFDGLNLNCDSRIICIMGHSGCGKTTLLHILAGLLKPSSGTVSDFPEKVSVMFQEDRLLPWLNAYENVAIVRSTPLVRWNGQDDIASEILRSLDIDPAMDIESMSGGMKRRVALARALAFDSEALLLDEPFKGMDEDLVARAAQLVRKQDKITIVSTHSEAEAKALGAEIVRLNQ